MIKKNGIKNTTKALLIMHIAFLMICALFFGMTISMLSDSKTATGTVTFALTKSPELSMNLNLERKGTEHTTYLGSNHDAKVTSESDVLAVNITQDSKVTITLTFNNNNIIISDDLNLTSQINGITLSNISNSNGVAIFETNESATIPSGDYIILDKLLSGIYLEQEIQNSTYSIEIKCQDVNSVPAIATLSGKYTNILSNVTVNFTTNDNYGTVTPSTISVPYGTTYSASGNTMTFIYNEIVVATVTATPLENTPELQYSFSGWSSNEGAINDENVTITANFTVKELGYIISYDSNGGTSVTQQKTDSNGQLTLTTQEPTKQDSLFLGWNIQQDGSGETIYEAGKTYQFNDNTTLYAQWATLITDLTFTEIQGSSPTTYSVKGNNKNATDIVIPKYIRIENGNAYSIPSNKFECSAVVKIDNKAFENYQMKNIIIPDSITEIGYNAFAACRKLQSLYIPASVTTFGNAWIEACDLLRADGTDTNPVVLYGGNSSYIRYEDIGNGYDCIRYAYYIQCADTIKKYEIGNHVCCVYEDTLIFLADGTTKRADEIVLGDKVLSYNFETGEIEVDTITEIIQRNRQELVTINFKDGTNIKITNDHPLYTELGWKCYDTEIGNGRYGDLGIVGEFTVGDKLLSLSKYFDKEVISIDYEEDNLNGYNTYQFGGNNNNNYFANEVLSSGV